MGRRRQGKTDYYARQRLVRQDKNKYDSKKYRLVVRRTNSKFISQIIFSTMVGDKVLCSAESEELKRFGLTAGLTNYSAGYTRVFKDSKGRKWMREFRQTGADRK